MRLVIDWEERAIYEEKEFPNLIASIIEYGAIDSFKSYLDENYYTDEVFNFTEAEKAEVRTRYEKYQKDAVKRAIETYDKYNVIEINSENKVKIF